MPHAAAPLGLIERIADLLGGAHAGHLLGGVVAALGSHLTPEPVPVAGDDWRAVDLDTVLRLAGLLRSGDRMELLAPILSTASPWLPVASATIAAPAPPPVTGPLTARQVEILDLVSHGLTNPQIGRKLHLAEHTVKTHLTRAYEALGADDRAHAVRLAFQAGILTHRD